MSRDSKKKKQRQSLYTVEFGSPVDTIRNGDDLEDRENSLSPKPMTPRRVKRRSVMTRGTSSRQSNKSRRSDRTGTQRSSTRSSRRKIHQNPVTKLIDQQQNSFPSFKHNNNSNLTENNLKSLNNDYIMHNQYHHPYLPDKPAKQLPVLKMNTFEKKNNTG